MSAESFDVIVVGAGVLGTFHAYHAARSNKKVLLLEKDLSPVQATVRNFGQIVPSGMSSDWFDWARRSLEIYSSIQNEFDISLRRNGSIYFASNSEEVQLIHELHSIMKERDYPSQLLSTNECGERWPRIKSDYVKEGLFFPSEFSAEPETMIYKLLTYVSEKLKIDYRPNAAVISCQPKGSLVSVETSNNQKFLAEHVIICNGSDFKLLFPEWFAQSGIVVSKLQMMRTIPLKNIPLKGNILTGLTIRRYESFEECPSFPSLKNLDHLTELKKWGIHILFKQAIDGSIIIGDSHEYASVNKIENLKYEINSHVNELILHEASRIVDFDVYQIASTWAGFYSQHPEKDIIEMDFENRIHIRTAIGGKGMTSSAGYAEASIQKIYGL
ncbi:MAG TPA: TIGR03364 family FAD-dependent oxidoreductase [Cytophagales bacterium]|jgi:FAD dependent oxidoreductase TIGR03364|nr:TIGR03364 family FAD-dependent oxidoreductase [Cytophagales bacterium]